MKLISEYNVDDQRIRLVATADLLFLLRIVFPSNIDFGVIEINVLINEINNLALKCVRDMMHVVPTHETLSPQGQRCVKELDAYWRAKVAELKKLKRPGTDSVAILEAADICVRDALVICKICSMRHYVEIQKAIAQLLEYLYNVGSEDEILEQGMYLYLKSSKIIKKYW